ncbi:MAG TPA: glycogen debranching enzyme N-terminal domain-containing protein, partial [Pirellulales bacterium]|nr:glycogen debranching enzyme N-terminal domain-containing protein [Pirellulales bacterium]
MTEALAHRMPWSRHVGDEAEELLRHEWLFTNALGGYASGTVAGVCTRRYHGLLVAALPAPLGRMMMFNHVTEAFRLPNGGIVPLAGDHPRGIAQLEVATLASFSLDFGMPVWRYDVDGYILEKRVVMPHRANAVHLIYRLVAGRGRIRLRMEPGLHFRPHEGPATTERFEPYHVKAAGDRFEIIAPDVPCLR